MSTAAEANWCSNALAEGANHSFKLLSKSSLVSWDQAGCKIIQLILRETWTKIQKYKFTADLHQSAAQNYTRKSKNWNVCIGFAFFIVMLTKTGSFHMRIKPQQTNQKDQTADYRFVQVLTIRLLTENTNQSLTIVPTCNGAENLAIKHYWQIQHSMFCIDHQKNVQFIDFNSAYHVIIMFGNVVNWCNVSRCALYQSQSKK